MNLEPLVDASFAIRIHVASVVPAALIGPYLFWARKGTPIHRLAGRVWLGLMALAALSSFFIHEINFVAGFSPIHLISIYVLAGIWLAYRAARQRRIASHRRQVMGLYLGGIVGAGLFTLLPGRIMHEVVFAEPQHWPGAGQLLALVGLMTLVVAMLVALSVLAQARPVAVDR
jgi:uncharacterized membrane protein